jgi:hypothetical protein
MEFETTTKLGATVTVFDYAHDEPEALASLLRKLDGIKDLVNAKIYCSPRKTFVFKDGTSANYLEWKISSGVDEKKVRISPEDGEVEFFTGLLRIDESREQGKLIFETEF